MGLMARLLGMIEDRDRQIEALRSENLALRALATNVARETLPSDAPTYRPRCSCGATLDGCFSTDPHDVAFDGPRTLDSLTRYALRLERCLPAPTTLDRSLSALSWAVHHSAHRIRAWSSLGHYYGDDPPWMLDTR